MTPAGPLRIGTLGAARITPFALIKPARYVPEVEVVAVAARDRERAEKFARKHGIPRVLGSYLDLVRDPEIDAVYNPLPNSYHCEWTIRALEAGKHVLCEKPIASNAREAALMAEAAKKNGKVLVEAFHYRYHPLAARLREIIDSGELGGLEHVEAHLCIFLPFTNDIRYRYDLSGGATMDTGCYAINMVRYLAGSEPEVVYAQARLKSDQVDRFMEAELRFPNGITGRITCSLWSIVLVRPTASVRGKDGRLHVLNPWAPQLPHLIRVKSKRGSRQERVAGEATYTHQLRAFASMVNGGPPMATDAQDAVKNMRVIDAVYKKAGLRPRGT